MLLLLNKQPPAGEGGVRGEVYTELAETGFVARGGEVWKVHLAAARSKPASGSPIVMLIPNNFFHLLPVNTEGGIGEHIVKASILMTIL
jgi:hypothetical protein